jgi:formate-dependent nitrite reductase membrane component NrfD
MMLAIYLKWTMIAQVSFFVASALAIIVAIYTAFLFAQAKGRDFWQSPVLAIHMLTHAVMCGAGALSLLGFFVSMHPVWGDFLWNTLMISTSFHLVIMFFELATPHPTSDAKEVGRMILKGRYNIPFWTGVVSIGNVIPILLLMVYGTQFVSVASVFVLVGVYIAEHVWVHAPQRISLT